MAAGGGIPGKWHLSCQEAQVLDFSPLLLNAQGQVGGNHTMAMTSSSAKWH